MGRARCSSILTVLCICFSVFGQEHLKQTGIFDTGDSATCHTVSSVDGNILTRRTYDTSYRLLSVETWKLGAAAASASLFRYRTYTYSGTDSTADFSTDANSATLRETDTIYNRTDRMTVQKTFLLKKIDASAQSGAADGTESGGEKTEATGLPGYWKIPAGKTVLQYDSNGRLAEKIVTDFASDGKESVRRKVSQHYRYGGKSSRPDMREYENGELRKEIIYLSEETYMQRLFFSNDCEVQTMFTSGRKIGENFVYGTEK